MENENNSEIRKELGRFVMTNVGVGLMVDGEISPFFTEEEIAVITKACDKIIPLLLKAAALQVASQSTKMQEILENLGGIERFENGLDKAIKARSKEAIVTNIGSYKRNNTNKN